MAPLGKSNITEQTLGRQMLAEDEVDRVTVSSVTEESLIWTPCLGLEVKGGYHIRVLPRCSVLIGAEQDFASLKRGDRSFSGRGGRGFCRG